MSDDNDQNKSVVLLTAAWIDAETFVQKIGDSRLELLHLPLERYTELDETDKLEATLNEADTVVHSNKRNAYFFIRRVKQLDLLYEVRQRVNLANDELTAQYLEGQGIPAIFAGGDKPIQIVEFLLSFRRTGPTLFPCGRHQKEEIPGLLHELDIPVNEVELYKLEGPTEADLAAFREDLSDSRPQFVVFHNRRSVKRILAAFPGVDFQKSLIIAGDQGVADKLKKEDIEAESVAVGDWESIYDCLKELVRM